MNDFAFDTLLYAAAGDVRSERLAAYRAAPPRNIKKILLCAAVAAMLLSMGIFAQGTNFFRMSYQATDNGTWSIFFTQGSRGAPTLEKGDGLYSYTVGWLPEGTVADKTKKNSSSYSISYRKAIGIRGAGYYTMTVRVTFASNNTLIINGASKTDCRTAKIKKISTGAREYVALYDDQNNLELLFFEEAGMAVRISVHQWEQNEAEILQFADSITFTDKLINIPDTYNVG